MKRTRYRFDFAFSSHTLQFTHYLKAINKNIYYNNSNVTDANESAEIAKKKSARYTS